MVTLSVSDLKWTQHRVEKVVNQSISGKKPNCCANLRSHAPNKIKLLINRLSKIAKESPLTRMCGMSAGSEAS